MLVVEHSRHETGFETDRTSLSLTARQVSLDVHSYTVCWMESSHPCFRSVGVEVKQSMHGELPERKCCHGRAMRTGRLYRELWSQDHGTLHKKKVTELYRAAAKAIAVRSGPTVACHLSLRAQSIGLCTMPQHHMWLVGHNKAVFAMWLARCPELLRDVVMSHPPCRCFPDLHGSCRHPTMLGVNQSVLPSRLVSPETMSKRHLSRQTFGRRRPDVRLLHCKENITCAGQRPPRVTLGRKGARHACEAGGSDARAACGAVADRKEAYLRRLATDPRSDARAKRTTWQLSLSDERRRVCSPLLPPTMKYAMRLSHPHDDNAEVAATMATRLREVASLCSEAAY